MNHGLCRHFLKRGKKSQVVLYSYKVIRNLDFAVCLVPFVLCDSESILVTLICKGSVMFLVGCQVGEDP